MGDCKITIPTCKAKELQDILDGPELKDVKNAAVIEVYTAKFGNGIEADVRIVNGDTPYIDSVLFDNGHEVDVLEPGYMLVGEYDFRYKGKNYFLEIITGEG